jgi:hypothetical protein
LIAVLEALARVADPQGSAFAGPQSEVISGCPSVVEV